MGELDFHQMMTLGSDSPGTRGAQMFDLPLIRDKDNNYEPLETVMCALISGCYFGRQCLTQSKDPRKWIYNTIAITDTFMVSLHKNDILKMVENQKRRILNDQMNFFKQIPSPEFKLLSKKKLQNICEVLQVFSCIKGTVIFNQDDPLKYIYVVKEGLFSSQVRLTVSRKMQGLNPGEMLKEAEESSGKLASKSKTMSTKATGKKYKMHQIASLGQGSVIGCEDVLVAKSDVHVTTLTCLSMTGELFRIERDFFFGKLQTHGGFMRKLEKQCLENVRDQVRKI